MPWKLLGLAEEGRVELCMAPAMLDELAKVLSYKRLQPRLMQLGLTSAELIAYALSLVSIFEVTEGPRIVLADPDDDIFLHCAIVADAAYIVSGDNHLLDLGMYEDTPILTIRDFFATEFPEQIE